MSDLDLITTYNLGFSDYEVYQNEKGFALRHKVNHKSFIANLTQEDFIPSNLYDKYKGEFQIDRRNLDQYLKVWKIEYIEKKGRTPSHDHIIQQGVKWIRENCKKNEN